MVGLRLFCVPGSPFTPATGPRQRLRRTQGGLTAHDAAVSEAPGPKGLQGTLPPPTHRVFLMLHALSQHRAEGDGGQRPRLFPHGPDLQKRPESCTGME